MEIELLSFKDVEIKNAERTSQPSIKGKQCNKDRSFIQTLEGIASRYCKNEKVESKDSNLKNEGTIKKEKKDILLDEENLIILNLLINIEEQFQKIQNILKLNEDEKDGFCKVLLELTDIEKSISLLQEFISEDSEHLLKELTQNLFEFQKTLEKYLDKNNYLLDLMSYQDVADNVDILKRDIEALFEGVMEYQNQNKLPEDKEVYALGKEHNLMNENLKEPLIDYERKDILKSKFLEKSPVDNKEEYDIPKFQIEVPLNNSEIDDEKNIETWQLNKKINIDDYNLQDIDKLEEENIFGFTFDNKDNILFDTESSMISDVRETPVVNKNDLIRQIVDKTKLILKGNKPEIRIKLKPEILGELILKVEVEKGAVLAKALVDNYRTKELIEANIIELKEGLEEQGLEIKTFEVSVGNNRDFEKNENENFSETFYQKPKKIKVNNRDLKNINTSYTDNTNIDESIDYGNSTIDLMA